MEEYYNNCRLFVVPTRFAAGVPWKLEEAMSFGVPTVVTPLIASQLNLKHKKQVLIGKNAKEFADSVVALYKNEKLWNSDRGEGLKHIKKFCSPVKLKKDLGKILKKWK